VLDAEVYAFEDFDRAVVGNDPVQPQQGAHPSLSSLSCRLLTMRKESGHEPDGQDVRAAANRHEMEGARRFALTDGSPVHHFDAGSSRPASSSRSFRKLRTGAHAWRERPLRQYLRPGAR